MGFAGSDSRKFSVEILQNGETQKITGNTVLLEKKPFQIRVTLINHPGIYMNSSWNRDYFDLEEKEEIPDFRFIDMKARAEAKFNEDMDLVMEDEYFSYLFYDPRLDWHRFDEEQLWVKGKKVTGIKTVSRLSELHPSAQIETGEVEKDIYLFFVASNEPEIREEAAEYQRMKIHIKWK
jgi:hypothetical protein